MNQKSEFILQHGPSCTVVQWQEMINCWADLKGWNRSTDMTPNDVLASLMLITGEVAEASEDVRDGKMETYLDAKGKPCGFPSEIADTVIRCLHLASMLKIDLAKEIATKMEYNYSRPFRHGGKLA